MTTGKRVCFPSSTMRPCTMRAQQRFHTRNGAPQPQTMTRTGSGVSVYTNVSCLIEYIVHGSKNGLLYDLTYLFTLVCSVNLSYLPYRCC